MEAIPGSQGWGKPTPDYRKISALFTELQGLFDHNTGHDHSGADKGKLIDTDGLTDEAVTLVKAKVFVSAEQVANGNPQNIAHGLGVAPSAVLVVPTDTGADGVFVVTEGAHDDTNVVVTVTNTKKYKVFAWA